MGTSDREGRQDVSPKGDGVGFVKVLGDSTLLVPERIGNRLAFGFRDIIETGMVGLIFVVPIVKETVRVYGRARISHDPELLAALSSQWKPATLCTIVDVHECFFHCGKAFIRSKLWRPDSWPKDTGVDMAKPLAAKMDLDEEELRLLIDEGYKNRLY